MTDKHNPGAGRLVLKPINSVAERDRLVLENYRLTYWALNRLRRLPAVRRLGEDDALGAAALGLLRAGELYDGSKVSPVTGRPISFSGYAYMWIRSAVAEACRRDGRQCLRAFSEVLGVLEDGVSFADKVFVDTTDDRRRGRAERAEQLAVLLSAIPLRHRQAVELRYLEGLMFREVGRRMGVSQQRARQLVEQGVVGLRRAAGVA